MPKLHVSAGGKGERIQTYISSMFDSGLPKHLLPIPCLNSSLLGEIVSSASIFFDEIVIWTNSDNFSKIKEVFKPFTTVTVLIDTYMTGPLGPMVRAVLSEESDVFACAGDFFCDFHWSDFYSFHIKNESNISILIANSIDGPGGARFYLSNDRIESWERVPITSSRDLINIGCYIISPNTEVFNLLNSLKRHKEDDFFDMFIPKEFVNGYVPNNKGYNINTPEVYRALVSDICSSDTLA